jgi:D,D-heptose 1,7-bisphosphate phosphatase
MKHKAIFLDRDGTINVDEGYTYKIEDLKFIPNAVEGLKKLSRLDYNLIIFTNQSGIGKSYYTEEDYLAFRDEMHKRLKEQGVLISAEYFCPHNEEDNCTCRKPKPGMIEKAAEEFNFDLNKCWVIGDSTIDIQSGIVLGIKTIQVLTGKQQQLSYADFVAKDLVEAADYIYMFDNKNK